MISTKRFMGGRIAELIDAFGRRKNRQMFTLSLMSGTVVRLSSGWWCRLFYEAPDAARSRLDLLRSKYDNRSPVHFEILLDVRPVLRLATTSDNKLQCGVLNLAEVISFFAALSRSA